MEHTHTHTHESDHEQRNRRGQQEPLPGNQPLAGDEKGDSDCRNCTLESREGQGVISSCNASLDNRDGSVDNRDRERGEGTPDEGTRPPNEKPKTPAAGADSRDRGEGEADATLVGVRRLGGEGVLLPTFTDRDGGGRGRT